MKAKKEHSMIWRLEWAKMRKEKKPIWKKWSWRNLRKKLEYLLSNIMIWECAEPVITDSITTKCFQIRVNKINYRKHCCILYLLLRACLFDFKKSKSIRGETAVTNRKRIQNNTSAWSVTGCSCFETGWKSRFLFGWYYVAQVYSCKLDWLIYYMILLPNWLLLINNTESWMILILNQEFS